MNKRKTEDFHSSKMALPLWLIKFLPALHLQEALPGSDCTPMKCEGGAEAASLSPLTSSTQDLGFTPCGLLVLREPFMLE